MSVCVCVCVCEKLENDFAQATQMHLTIMATGIKATRVYEWHAQG